MWPGKPHIRGVRQAVGAQISGRKLGYCGNFSLAPDQQDDHLIPPHLKILLSGTSPSKETPPQKKTSSGFTVIPITMGAAFREVKPQLGSSFLFYTRVS